MHRQWRTTTTSTSTSTSTSIVRVAGTVTSAVTRESTSGDTLANSGVDATGGGVIGVGLLGAGAMLAFAGRRRRRTV